MDNDNLGPGMSSSEINNNHLSNWIQSIKDVKYFSRNRRKVSWEESKQIKVYNEIFETKFWETRLRPLYSLKAPTPLTTLKPIGHYMYH